MGCEPVYTHSQIGFMQKKKKKKKKKIANRVHALLTIIAQHKKKTVTTMLTYPWKCTVSHCNHLGNTWKPLVLMTRHFDYCLTASEGDNQSVSSSAPVVSRCFPRGYNVKLYISRGRLAWWLLAFLHSVETAFVYLNVTNKPWRHIIYTKQSLHTVLTD